GHRHQAAIVTIGGIDPRAATAKLITNVEVHRQTFVVVRTCDVAVGGAETDAPNLGTKQSRAHVTGGEKSSKAMKGIQGGAQQSAVDLGFAELSGKSNRAVQQYVEIVSTVGELPEVLGANRK